MTISLVEDRRPGLRELAEKLKREHPSWSASRCANEAKQIWSRLNPSRPNRSKS